MCLGWLADLLGGSDEILGVDLSIFGSLAIWIFAFCLVSVAHGCSWTFGRGDGV